MNVNDFKPGDRVTVKHLVVSTVADGSEIRIEGGDGWAIWLDNEGLVQYEVELEEAPIRVGDTVRTEGFGTDTFVVRYVEGKELVAMSKSDGLYIFDVSEVIR